MGVASPSMLVGLSEHVIRILGRAQTNSRPPMQAMLRGLVFQLSLFGIFPTGMGLGKREKTVRIGGREGRAYALQSPMFGPPARFDASIVYKFRHYQGILVDYRRRTSCCGSS